MVWGLGFRALAFTLRLIPSAFNLTYMKKVKITQVKSVIDRPERQKRTMIALGIKKMNGSVEVEATPQILGMITKVNHLVTVVDA
jgi:large subunit ribosomal protein L30